jgi:hypothetical protein
MFWHRTAEHDLETCLAINPSQMGHELVGRNRALVAWRSLMKSPSFVGCTVESEIPLCNHRIMGFGSGVFVSRAFLDRELAEPRPGVNARIVASIAERCPVVLSKEELKHSNTCGGVDVVFLTAAVRADLLDPKQVGEVRSQLWLACLMTYRGYRFHRVVRESMDAADVAYMTSHGVYGSVFAFEDGALMVSTRDDAMARPGSILAILYSFREPTLGLSEIHQQLLEAAMEGLTDEELAESLSMKLPTVKKRWAAIFDRVACTRSDLSIGSNDDPDRHTRGPQKRHHLLAYLREHPEELRPWLSTRTRSTFSSARGTIARSRR